MTMRGVPFAIVVIAGAIAAASAGTVAAGDTSDDAMTCEAIATELGTLAQPLVPTIGGYGASSEALYAQSRALYERRKAQHMALAAIAEAGSVDPTGAAKRAYAVAEAAQAAKEQAENRAIADSPLATRNRGEGDALAAQGAALQSSARVQALLAKAQRQGCTRR